MLSELFSRIVEFLISTIGSLGYFGIFILMAIESSILPLPSELVIPPAGVLIFRGELSAPLVIIFGTLGSLAGALVNYFISLSLGRKIVDKLVAKYGHFLLLKPEKLTNAEIFFRKHGEIATFTGRLIPVVRHLISIPAGFSRMNLFKFCFYTSLGSAIWVSILAYLGYLFGENQALITSNLKIISLWLVLISAIIILIYILIKRVRKKN